ncbi:MAG: energy-coupling factor ABC transporter permease [Bryobacterales bacterium]|nr:energy-coupling factor ABC transporter permease [Bryobacteraceae bacterium]MDW8129334.1 energy-coupling factor ABC transporter permease [Bryobacterales bacterium]
MHIPDGFLHPLILAGTATLSAVAVAVAARKAQRELEESRFALLGVTGAFVFAAQMVNFPLGFGTSSHLLGGMLLAVTLGLAPAMVTMTAILVVQALVFQDGGVLALGANVLNMAVAGIAAGYLPYALWSRGRLRWFAILAGGFLSVVASGAMAMAELVLSGVRIPAALLWSSAVLLTASGLLEGLLTLAVVRALRALQPSALERAQVRRSQAVLGVLAVLLAGGIVAVASEAPDVLDSLADRVGIAERARALLTTPLAEYRLSWAPGSWWSQATAGLLGLALTYGAGVALARALRRRRSA